MIGSGTIIVREKGKLAIHIFDGMSWVMSKGKERSYEALAKSVRKWGKPDAEITQEVADEILHSHQCVSREYGPFYSQYAGDVVLLLDFDEMMLYTRGYTDLGDGRRGINGTEFWKALDEPEA